MPDMDGFGHILRQTRINRGLDFNTVARRLRIRPDILQAIENEDFDAMPPRGYARNMINAYARYLGLNVSEITSQYLDMQHAHDVDRARRNARPSGFNMASAERRTSPFRNGGSHSRSNLPSERYRQQDHDRPRFTYEGNPDRFGRRHYNEGDYRSDGYRPDGRGDRDLGARTHRSRGRAVADNDYLNLYAPPSTGGFFSSRLPWIIGGAIILILLIIILVLIFRPAESAQPEVTNLPVTGVEESSSSAAVAPSSFTFSFKVDSGTTTWVEVHLNDETEIAQTITGPEEQSFDCNGTLQFICGTTEGISAELDGEPVKLADYASDGIVNVEVSLSDILEQWQKEHPGAATSSSSRASSSSSSTSQTPSSSSSARS